MAENAVGGPSSAEAAVNLHEAMSAAVDQAAGLQRVLDARRVERSGDDGGRHRAGGEMADEPAVEVNPLVAAEQEGTSKIGSLAEAAGVELPEEGRFHPGDVVRLLGAAVRTRDLAAVDEIGEEMNHRGMIGGELLQNDEGRQTLVLTPANTAQQRYMEMMDKARTAITAAQERDTQEPVVAPEVTAGSAASAPTSAEMPPSQLVVAPPSTEAPPDARGRLAADLRAAAAARVVAGGAAPAGHHAAGADRPAAHRAPEPARHAESEPAPHSASEAAPRVVAPEPSAMPAATRSEGGGRPAARATVERGKSGRGKAPEHKNAFPNEEDDVARAATLRDFPAARVMERMPAGAKFKLDLTDSPKDDKLAEFVAAARSSEELNSIRDYLGRLHRGGEHQKLGRVIEKTSAIIEAQEVADKLRAAADRMQAERMDRVRARLNAPAAGGPAATPPAEVNPPAPTGSEPAPAPDATVGATQSPASELGEYRSREIARINRQEQTRAKHLNKEFDQMIEAAGGDAEKVANLNKQRGEALADTKGFFETARWGVENPEPGKDTSHEEQFNKEAAFINKREHDRIDYLGKTYDKMIIDAGQDTAKVADLQARREEALANEKAYFENVRSERFERAVTNSPEVAQRRADYDKWHEEALAENRFQRKRDEINDFWMERIAQAKDFTEKQAMEEQRKQALVDAEGRHNTMSGEALRFGFDLSSDLLGKNYREYTPILGGDENAEDQALARREVMGLEPVPMIEIKKGGLFHRKENRGPKIVEAYFRTPGNNNVVVVERRDRATGALISQEVMTTPAKIRQRTTIKGSAYLPPSDVMRRAATSRKEVFKAAMNDHKTLLGGQQINKFVSSPSTQGLWESVYGGRYGANSEQRAGAYSGPKRGGFLSWITGGFI